jgi:hypothetical protein
MLTKFNKREQATVVCVTVACSQEVCQEEPKEKPVGDIALPNSTSLAHSIAGGGGVVIEQDAQCSWVEFVKVVTKAGGWPVTPTVPSPTHQPQGHCCLVAP